MEKELRTIKRINKIWNILLLTHNLESRGSFDTSVVVLHFDRVQSRVFQGDLGNFQESQVFFLANCDPCVGRGRFAILGPRGPRGGLASHRALEANCVAEIADFVVGDRVESGR